MALRANLISLWERLSVKTRAIIASFSRGLIAALGTVVTGIILAGGKTCDPQGVCTKVDLTSQKGLYLLGSVLAGAALKFAVDWFRKSNPLFGRTSEDPIEFTPGVDGPIVEPVVEDVDPIDLPDVDNDEVVPVGDDETDDPVDLTLD